MIEVALGVISFASNTKKQEEHPTREAEKKGKVPVATQTSV
jgi:hypothetical protein